MRSLIFLCATALAACSGDKPADPSASSSVRTFGAPLSARAATPLETLLASPDGYSGKEILTAGHVKKTCDRKGCWMEIATSAAADAPSCRVTFKDYGFFVPKGASGYSTRLEGTLEVRTIEKEQVDHYESEGARFAAKLPDGTAREVRIVATGVEMTKAAVTAAAN